MQNLPQHLKKYIVQQNYEKYTSIDQACWRFIMRQLRSYLKDHAHECYIEGLEKTGIETDSIPRIENISAKLEKFGWRALPVSGFIPPAAFMELQSLSILPIASDMRTIDHLTYTPAPDIVHEAAGHAPILIHPEFAAYLKKYAEVAKKAIISKEDLDLYEAIRVLSDIKESPDSTLEKINDAQKKLDFISKNISHVSEASELSRMNWWTAEYGLIGDMNNPKIFGAGLLSSVGESKWCLSDKVKKIPLTVDCIQTTYDITEPQPQLFVTPDFKTLSKVLDDMAAKMAFKHGGKLGLEKAIKAQTVNTAVLNSGIQISGVIQEVIYQQQNPTYLICNGPTQLCYADSELSGHGKKYHQHGFGTAIGFLKENPHLCLSKYTEEDLQKSGITEGKNIELQFTSGITVSGLLKKIHVKNKNIILMSFENCRVFLKQGSQERVLFQPEWGTYDMAVGSSVISVFGGPADRVQYGDLDDFVAARVPNHHYSDADKLLQTQYLEIRKLRESKKTTDEITEKLDQILSIHNKNFKNDWLLRLEALEIVEDQLLNKSNLSNQRLLKIKYDLLKTLADIQNNHPSKKEVIQSGLDLLK